MKYDYATYLDAAVIMDAFQNRAKALAIEMGLCVERKDCSAENHWIFDRADVRSDFVHVYAQDCSFDDEGGRQMSVPFSYLNDEPGKHLEEWRKREDAYQKMVQNAMRHSLYEEEREL